MTAKKNEKKNAATKKAAGRKTARAAGAKAPSTPKKAVRKASK